ncbi:MAG: hypothetical protein M3546_09565 [Actinomycetota bacterium]|nr:hypothetical protein [Actinomycetota bacterium]
MAKIVSRIRHEPPDADASAKRERRLRNRARAWKPDAELDRLVALRNEQPQSYASFPATLKIRLGYYLEAKALAERFGGEEA